MGRVITVKQSEELQERLELEVDRYGLCCVLINLSIVCQYKAEHLTVEHGNIKAANNWMNAGGVVDKVITKVDKYVP